MNPDDFKQAWQAQTSHSRLAIDTEQLLREVRIKQQQFAAMIYWRDFREVVTAVVMLPVWIIMGIFLSLPWAWYLMIPALLWVAGYLLVDRRRHRHQSAAPDESLRHCLETSLAQVNHQIWLLRNVAWWYLLPLTLPMVAFFGQISWNLRATGWESVCFFCLATGMVGGFYFALYLLNQYAVKKALEPRRQELTTLITSLTDEPAAS